MMCKVPPDAHQGKWQSDASPGTSDTPGRAHHVVSTNCFNCWVQLELRSIEQSKALLRGLGNLTSCIKRNCVNCMSWSRAQEHSDLFHPLPSIPILFLPDFGEWHDPSLHFPRGTKAAAPREPETLISRKWTRGIAASFTFTYAFTEFN